jgi:hypothetical protein
MALAEATSTLRQSLARPVEAPVMEEHPGVTLGRQGADP